MSQFQTYQTALVTERDELVAELTTIARQNTETGDWVAVPPTESSESADSNTQADIAEEWNERRALLAQLEMRFHHIELALQKINDGTYGVCEICHDAITPERLRVNPASRTCQLHMERARELPL